MLGVNHEPAFDHGDRVSRAVELVRAQADCTMEEAFVLMHERATMSRIAMEHVVDGLIDGSIRFDP
jgi:AmiR/NasT family two-component response regulator